MFAVNSRGFSLVAAMVSIAIVGVIVLTVMNLISLSGDILNTFNNTLRAMDAAQEVRFALTDPTTCSLNLRGINLNGTSIAGPAKLGGDLMYPDPADKTKLSTHPVLLIDNSEGDQLALDGIYLHGSNSANLAYVEVRLRKKADPPGAPASHMRSLPIWVQTAPSGQITCCTTLNMAACP